MRSLTIKMIALIAFVISGCVGPAKKAEQPQTAAMNPAMVGKDYSVPAKKKSHWKHQAKLCSKGPKNGKAKPARRDAASACEPYASVLYNSEFSNTGSVSVYNDATTLYIDLAANTLADWSFDEVRFYVGTAPVPVDINGLPNLSLFTLDPLGSNQTEKSYAIPLASIGINCGTKINVAVTTHAIQTGLDGSVRQQDDAWAFGPSSFPGDAAAWAFEYTPCCSDVGDTGCTLTQGFYKNNNTYAKPPKNIPWLIPETTLLCGKKWYDIMKTVPKSGDAWSILAQQWITAKLNVAFGASTGTIIDQAIADSQAILNNNCRTIPKEMKQTAMEYKGLLEAYNNGFTGPGHCE